jgi:hypothetical protein
MNYGPDQAAAFRSEIAELAAIAQGNLWIPKSGKMHLPRLKVDGQPKPAKESNPNSPSTPVLGGKVWASTGKLKRS